MVGPVSFFGDIVSVWVLSGSFIFVCSWVGVFVIVWPWILFREGQDTFQKRWSGQWDEGSGRRGAVGQWRWEEGRSIWISIYCFCFFICLPMVSFIRLVRR